jgi:hypothetical protein
MIDRFLGYTAIFVAGMVANQIIVNEALRPKVARIRMMVGFIRLQRDIQRSQVLAHERTMKAHGLALDHDCCAVCEEHVVV